ncbi:MAG TPA: ankyrin repeat domain-containing protein [Vicinamibacterales bacterium]|nr:ankyrin repeat domain-containing protein [Vicinamibacterales bacterium]
MADESTRTESLPDNPDIGWLRKQAKRRLEELRREDPQAQLARAQFELAQQYGFASWRALKAHVEALTLDGQLFDAARTGDAPRLAGLLDEHPARLHARSKPYGWTLLHAAARHLAAVDVLLTRGVDVNAREGGDNTYAMHWAAAAGEVDVVRRLADAGGDVVGQGDDHELEVIGWAACWDGCDDVAHRAVADFLVRRGARHHIFSAVAMNLADEVRHIVRADPSALNKRQSRNENHRTPLQFAVMKRRPEMVALLLELGADPLAVDGVGQPVAAYAADAAIDRAVMERIRVMVAAEMLSADRGQRAPRGTSLDLVALLSLRDWDMAARLLKGNPQVVDASGGALHLVTQRNDLSAVQWLLDKGADVDGRWSSGGAVVTPLHLAASRGHAVLVRSLLEAGANPTIRDSMHDRDPLGWAEYFHKPEIVQILRAHLSR